MAMAMTTAGNANSASMNRERTASSTPLPKPAAQPMSALMGVLARVEMPSDNERCAEIEKHTRAIRCAAIAPGGVGCGKVSPGGKCWRSHG